MLTIFLFSEPFLQPCAWSFSGIWPSCCYHQGLCPWTPRNNVCSATLGSLELGTGASPGAGLHQHKLLLRQRSLAASPVPALRNGYCQRPFERVSCCTEGDQRELCSVRSLAVTQGRVSVAGMPLHLSLTALSEIEGSHSAPLKISLTQLRGTHSRATWLSLSQSLSPTPG